MSEGGARAVEPAPALASGWRAAPGRAAAAFDGDSPLLRQSATTISFALVLVLALTVPDFAIRDHTAVWISCALMVLAVVLSAVYTERVRRRGALIVPLLSMAAIAVGQVAVGSIMTPVLILPLIWLAVFPRRRWVVISGIMTALAMTLEFVWPGSPPFTSESAITVVLTTMIFTIVGAVVHRIADDNRQRLRANERLTGQREVMLDDAVGLVRQLRENEGQLEAAGALFRSVLNSVTRQSVVGTDLTGAIDVWNTGAQSMLGLAADDVIGTRYMHEFHRGEELEDRARELGYPAGATVLNPGFSALVEVARLGGSEDRDWTYVRADGGTVPVHVAVTPRVDENGSTVGYIFVGNDISERKELARLQDEFVGLVSHELRTPISSILGYLELIGDESEAPLTDEQRHYLGVAERNAHRLLRLVGDLLFTAQVTAHKFPIESAQVDVNAVVAGCVESARPVSQRATVLLLCTPAPGTPVVRGDAMRIAQACDNLLSNAIKFTPRGGTVSVSVEAADGVVTVSVRDTGMGIPAEEMSMLSTRFFRASTATRSAVQGVGLGLSITKAIVTAHGGELSATSEVGVGTTFSFTLPLHRVG